MRRDSIHHQLSIKKGCIDLIIFYVGLLESSVPLPDSVLTHQPMYTALPCNFLLSVEHRPPTQRAGVSTQPKSNRGAISTVDTSLASPVRPWNLSGRPSVSARLDLQGSVKVSMPGNELWAAEVIQRNFEVSHTPDWESHHWRLAFPGGERQNQEKSQPGSICII